MTVDNLEYLPDPEKPISFDSFVEQYTPIAVAIMAQRGDKPDSFVALTMAEMVADTDIKTVQTGTYLYPEKTLKEVLVELLKPQPVSP